MFNVNNKRALLLVPLPWTYAALNLLIGSLVAVASWSVKIAPWPRVTRQVCGGFGVQKNRIITRPPCALTFCLALQYITFRFY